MMVDDCQTNQHLFELSVQAFGCLLDIHHDLRSLLQAYSLFPSLGFSGVD